ncbi:MULTISPECIES: hypothetical protein [unclassified Frankia]|uniref:hypothetical protein n=1 Tax=unclassified Frankia TaxID=2632575 RepID=UPI001A7E5D51|nr:MULTISPECIES: hypothetical protein [unclassified Frankia]
MVRRTDGHPPPSRSGNPPVRVRTRALTPAAVGGVPPHLWVRPASAPPVAVRRILPAAPPAPVRLVIGGSLDSVRVRPPAAADGAPVASPRLRWSVAAAPRVVVSADEGGPGGPAGPAVCLRTHDLAPVRSGRWTIAGARGDDGSPERDEVPPRSGRSERAQVQASAGTREGERP